MLNLTVRRAPRGEDGIVGVNLVLVLAFALFAVVMLTATTLSASQIDSRVKKINAEVETIDEELGAVPILDKTVNAAEEIRLSVEPLVGHAESIRDSANTINRTVDGINDSVNTINGTVAGIQGTAGAILNTVRSIDAGAATINSQVARVRGLVGGIKADTGSVRPQVGPGHGFPGGGKSIHGHANSIDCSLGPGGACGT